MGEEEEHKYVAEEKESYEEDFVKEKVFDSTHIEPEIIKKEPEVIEEVLETTTETMVVETSAPTAPEYHTQHSQKEPEMEETIEPVVTKEMEVEPTVCYSQELYTKPEVVITKDTDEPIIQHEKSPTLERQEQVHDEPETEEEPEMEPSKEAFTDEVQEPSSESIID